MIPAEQRVRTVSVCYAILCAGVVGVAVVLASSSWQGSWYRLLTDLAMLGVGFWGVLFGLALLNGVMSVLAFRFLRLKRGLRIVTLGVAAVFALWRMAILVSYFLSKNPVTSLVPVPVAWIGNSLLAVAYSMFAYMLWSAARTSNNRWRGP
jgi:hypothetical protein